MDLSITLDGKDSFADNPRYVECLAKQPLFPSLVNLYLTSGLHRDFGVHIALLCAISSPILSSLDLISSDVTIKSLSLLFRTLANHPSRNTFALVTIGDSKNIDFQEDEFPSSPSDVSLTVETFLPLCTLPKIRTFSISTWLPLPANDDLVRQLAAAWPELNRLEFIDARPPMSDEPRPRASYKSLFTLAQKCPRLARLTLPFNFADTPEFIPEVGPGRRGRPIALESLVGFSVGYTFHSYEPDTEWAAVRLLSATMPNLRCFNSRWWTEVTLAQGEHRTGTRLGRHAVQQFEAWQQYEAWEQFGEKVMGLAAVRKQERRWASEQGRRPRPHLC